MIVTACGATYLWHGAFEERSVPEQAGFEWTDSGWATQRHGIASKLVPYFDAKALALAEKFAASQRIDSMFYVPAPAGRMFLPYQRAGVAAMLQRVNADTNILLADEMRLGKSIQTIGLINACPDILSAIIVCPASIKLDWEVKLKAWLTVPMSIGIVWPNTKVLPRTSILIVNYDLLSRFVWPRTDLLVVDEAHLIKNPKTKRTRKVLGMLATIRLYLTGTPVPSRPEEAYTLLKSLDPKGWPSKEGYGVRYCAGYVGDHGWDFSGESNLEELHDRLRSTIMIRRLRSEVWAELPLVRREVIELPVDGRDRKLLRREEELREKVSYENQVHGLAAAQQVAFEEIALVRHETAMAKVPQVVQFIIEALEASDEKIVVFAWHTDVIVYIQSALFDAGYPALALIGATPPKDRLAIENAFRSDPKCKVLVGNLIAAGLGMDFSVSSRVIMAELDYVPGNVKQCEDRCQHPDKRDSVLVQHLVLQGSLDASIARILVKKQDVLDRALDGKQTEPINMMELFAS